MLSNRLKVIADLVPVGSKVVDVGTDHAYLPIYLYKSGISKDVTATDISKEVLKNSLDNIKKYNLEDKIKLVLDDGLTNNKEIFDTAVIAGMGTSTIIHILDSASLLPDTLIISSHNNHFELRKKLYDIGYYIDKEIAVLDSKIYYIIIRFERGYRKITEEELLFGTSNNTDYYRYLLEHYKDLYNKSNNIKYKEYTYILEDIIRKIED